MTEFVTEGHLGGYYADGDPATFFPELWEHCVTHLGVKSVIDVGCGSGIAVDYFVRLGCDVLGVDGMAQENPRIVRHDYSEGPYRPSRKVDLAWTCEFVEHVEKRFVGNFMATLRDASVVLMTHADPGQPGHHHVNCQPSVYWIGAMEANGFIHDEALTAETRRLAALNLSPWNHYTRSGMAFRNAQ